MWNTEVLGYAIHFLDPHSRAPKKYTSHGNEVLQQYTTHLIQRPLLPTRKSVPRSSRQLDHTKTSWPSLRDTICSGMVMSPVHQVSQNRFARRSERGEKRRQTEEEVGRQPHQWMDRPRVRQVPEALENMGGIGGNWLQNHLWCPNDLRDSGIGETRWDIHLALGELKSLCLC